MLGETDLTTPMFHRNNLIEKQDEYFRIKIINSYKIIVYKNLKLWF